MVIKPQHSKERNPWRLFERSRRGGEQMHAANFYIVRGVTAMATFVDRVRLVSGRAEVRATKSGHAQHGGTPKAPDVGNDQPHVLRVLALNSFAASITAPMPFFLRAPLR